MELANDPGQLAEQEFRTEALRWLPNVARYARLLARNQSDADDLAQETFLRAYINWKTFRPGSDCRRWLFAICRHLFLRTQQRESRIVGTEDGDLEADVQLTAEMYWDAAHIGLDTLFDRIDVAPALEQGLRGMHADYRDAVILVDVEGYTYAEAAVAVRVPIGTVRSRLFRGRRLLQQMLIEHARDVGLGSNRPTDDERRLA